MTGCGEIFEAIAVPSHRPAEPACQHADEHLFRVERCLTAEPTPDIGRDDANAVAGDFQQVGKQVADDPGDLRR